MADDPNLIDALVNIGGVLLGAALAFGATSHQARKQAAEERLARAYELFFTMHRVVNDILGYQRQLRTCVRPRSSNDTQDHLSQRMQPLVGVKSERVHIDPRALSVLTRTRDYEYITQLMELVEHHAVLGESLLLYASKRSAFMEKLRPTRVDGQTGTVEMTREEYLAIAGPLAELDDLAAQILRNAESGARLAVECIDKLGPKLKKATGAKEFPKSSSPDTGQLFAPPTSPSE